MFMSEIGNRLVLAVVTLMLLAGVASAQELTGMFEVVTPPPEQTARLLIEPAEQGYRLLFMGGAETSFQCTEQTDSELTCSGDFPITVRRDRASNEVHLTGDAVGPDPIILQYVPRASGGEAKVYRAEFENDGFMEATIVSGSDGSRMHWFGGEIVFDAILTREADGFLRGSVNNSQLSVTVDGDKATLLIEGIGMPQMTLGRVVYGDAGVPVRVADVGARFGDYALEGNLSTAFETWHGRALPPSARVSAERLAVRERLTLETGERTFSHLSPNGRFFLSHEQLNTSISIHESEAGEPVQTFTLPYPFDAPHTLSWSPRDNAIALARDAGLFGGIPGSRHDLFLLRREDGRVVNLTDESSVSSDSISTTEPSANLSATWVTPGRIVFERRDETQITVAAIDLSSRTVSRVVELPTTGGPTPAVLEFVPLTGELLATFPVDLFYDDNGVWTVGPGGRQFEIEVPFARNTNLVLGDVSFDGRYLLLMPDRMIRGVVESDAQPFILDRASGERVPIIPNASADELVLGAVFSPDGSKLLHLYRDARAKRDVLAVRDLANREANAVLIPDFPGYPNRPTMFFGDPGISWAANDRVMIAYDEWSRVMLLTVGPTGR